MIPDAVFFHKLSRLRMAMGHRASMNLTGNHKSTQKGSSMEFSDFREYMPGMISVVLTGMLMGG